MGLEAYILVTGIYDYMPAEVLMYPVAYYKNTKPETVVMGAIGKCPTDADSRRLAALCGISDIWDFNSHRLYIDKMMPESDIPELVSQSNLQLDLWHKLIIKCLRLGLVCYFMPEA